jgi:hypothetical protein
MKSNLLRTVAIFACLLCFVFSAQAQKRKTTNSCSSDNRRDKSRRGKSFDADKKSFKIYLQSGRCSESYRGPRPRNRGGKGFAQRSGSECEKQADHHTDNKKSSCRICRFRNRVSHQTSIEKLSNPNTGHIRYDRHCGRPGDCGTINRIGKNAFNGYRKTLRHVGGSAVKFLRKTQRKSAA